MLAGEIVPNEIERERMAMVPNFLLKPFVNLVNLRMLMRIVRFWLSNRRADVLGSGSPSISIFIGARNRRAVAALLREGP